jgi:hypothetical protein
MRVVAFLKDAVPELHEIERERIDPRVSPVAIRPQPVEHRRRQVRRDIGADLKVVAEIDLLASGAQASFDPFGNAVGLAEAVDEREPAALAAGHGRADGMAGLLAVK